MVLLALLLPAKGAVAAIMACAPASHAAVSGEHPEAAGSAHAAAHDHTDHRHSEASSHSDAHSGSDHSHDCTFCVSSCSLTPLLASDPVLPAVQAAALRYPGIVAPAPSFFSGGQERPPRTI